MAKSKLENKIELTLSLHKIAEASNRANEFSDDRLGTNISSNS